MEHKEFIRINKESNTAILFIHGIVGTPNHFNSFIPLVPNTVSVYNLLLDGHGKGVKDFSCTSMKKWEAQVQTVVDSLSLTHEKIYIVAHSMGGLFAIEQAIKNPKITKLFLLAVPIKLFIKPKMITNSLKVYFNKIDSGDIVALAAKSCYGIEQDKNLLNYIGWIPRYLELFKKIRYTRKILSALSTPCVACQSVRDEMVSKKSIQLLENNPAISVVQLKKSAHYYYEEQDFASLLQLFKKWII